MVTEERKLQMWINSLVHFLGAPRLAQLASSRKWPSKTQSLKLAVIVALLDFSQLWYWCSWTQGKWWKGSRKTPKNSCSNGTYLQQAETAHLHVFMQAFSKPSNQSELLIAAHKPQCSTTIPGLSDTAIYGAMLWTRSLRTELKFLPRHTNQNKCSWILFVFSQITSKILFLLHFNYTRKDQWAARMQIRLIFLLEKKVLLLHLHSK